MISREVVKRLKLREQKLDEDDPTKCFFQNEEEYKLGSKVTLRFHVVDTFESHHVFRFGKYENTATFFVPSDDQVAGFDAYIGMDNIERLRLWSYFFLGNKLSQVV